jgi:drug/metabolite transporter (DMT)-like permease
MNRPIKPPKPLPSSTVMSKELPKDEERVQESIEEKNPSASLPPTAQPVTPPPPPPTLSATGSSSKGLQTVLKNDSSDEKKVLKVEKRVNFQEDKPTGRSPEAQPPPLPSNPSIKKSAFLTPEHWAGKNIGQRPFQTPNKYQLSPTTELDTSQSSGPLPSAALGGGAVVTSGPGGVGVGAAGFPLKPIVLSPSEDEKLSDRLRMYHNIHYSDEWLMLTIFMHITLFTFLLTIGYDALTPVSLTILLIAATSVVLLLLFSRYHVGKLPRSLDWSQNVIRTPDQETDLITDDTIYLIGIAACIEGFALALYPVVTARYSRQNHVIEQDGFTSYTTLVQILAFGSLVIFGFYKILRPANRLDPLRTIFEVTYTVSLFSPLIHLPSSLSPSSDLLPSLLSSSSESRIPSLPFPCFLFSPPVLLPS